MINIRFETFQVIIFALAVSLALWLIASFLRWVYESVMGDE